MLVAEISKACAEAIAKAGMSPPIVFGVTARIGYKNRYYIAIASKENMDEEMLKRSRAGDGWEIEC